jgi:branched-chain amino acid transport system ATP-binding protein
VLKVERVSTFYGRVQVLWDLSLTVEEGQIVVVIGANGAGKSTLMKSISGLLKPASGTIRFRGEPITGMRPDLIVKRGIVLVPERRLCFGPLPVLDNLRLGSYKFRRTLSTVEYGERLSYVYALFPMLKERTRQKAQTLSGGEQQMLAIGRGLMADPKVLLLDEPSQGLGPLVIDMIVKALLQLHDKGLTLVLVEQNARLALEMADYGYVLETGRVTLEGMTESLRDNPLVQEIYLGGS